MKEKLQRRQSFAVFVIYDLGYDNANASFTIPLNIGVFIK